MHRWPEYSHTQLAIVWIEELVFVGERFATRNLQRGHADLGITDNLIANSSVKNPKLSCN